MKRADRSSRELVVNILCASFDDNTSINYIIKQDEKRSDRLRELMNYCFDVCIERGEVFLSDDEQACALIIHSEKKLGIIKQLVLDFRLAIHSIGISRVAKVLNRERLIEAHQPKDAFYYLWFIGVNPDKQGAGIGSTLIEELFQQLDQDEKHIYLETSVLRNLPWYEKYGFRIINEIDIGYKLYQMIR